ncbi:MAG: hypothetical protein WCH99_08785 [Verrucomicrobiota bacterium]
MSRNNNNGNGNTPNLNAVLVALSIRTFSNQRQDRAITDDVKLRKALGQGAGKWVKYKLPDECLTPIRKFCGIVRQFHYDHTSPWDEGQRLLSGKARLGYDARMVEFREEYEKLVNEFGEQYPNWIEQARIMHAGTFDQSDYPAWENCRAMFGISASYYPVPKPEHFSGEMKELYGNALVAITEKKVGEAVQDAWDRLLKPVQAMAEKLSSPDSIFRDSLVENVREMTALIPELNLTNDTGLTEAADTITKALNNLNAETLRESKVERKAAAEAAKDILNRFGGLGKRKLVNN